MHFYFFIPALIGVMSVAQNTLNRDFGSHAGLATAVFINACIVFASAGALLLATRWFPGRFEPFVVGAGASLVFKWWHVLPGIFGFCVIFGLPYAISKLGALNVFISFVTAQVLGSLAWEIFAQGVAPSWIRIAGATLALVGVFLVSGR